MIGVFICWEDDCPDRGKLIHTPFPGPASRRHAREHYNHRNPPKEKR